MADEGLNPVVYSKNVIELVTVANEYCKLIEASGSGETRDYIEKIQKILPLLYLKVAVISPVSSVDLMPEKFVSEVEYSYLQQRIVNMLGEHDDYLEVFDEGMQFSEQPIAASISENLTDIYQDLKDFIMNYQIGDEEIMQAGLGECLDNFRTYWGQKLVNCLRAIHQLVYSNIDFDRQLDSSATEEKKESDDKPDWLNKMFNGQED